MRRIYIKIKNNEEAMRSGAGSIDVQIRKEQNMRKKKIKKGEANSSFK
jgi:hypothetical protein